MLDHQRAQMFIIRHRDPGDSQYTNTLRLHNADRGRDGHFRIVKRSSVEQYVLFLLLYVGSGVGKQLGGQRGRGVRLRARGTSEVQRKKKHNDHSDAGVSIMGNWHGMQSYYARRVVRLGLRC